MKYKRNFNKTLFVKLVLLYSCNKTLPRFFKKYSLLFNVSKKIKYTLSFSVCCLNCKDRIEQTKIVFWNNWNNCQPVGYFSTSQQDLICSCVCNITVYYSIYIFVANLIYIYIFVYMYIHSQVYLEPLQTSKMECYCMPNS